MTRIAIPHDSTVMSSLHDLLGREPTDEDRLKFRELVNRTIWGREEAALYLGDFAKELNPDELAATRLAKESDIEGAFARAMARQRLRYALFLAMSLSHTRAWDRRSKSWQRSYDPVWDRRTEQLATILGVPHGMPRRPPRSCIVR